MADKIVFVLDRVPKVPGASLVDIITTGEFASMLADGWEVVSQADKEIPWEPRPKKAIMGERTILRRREENRGMSVAGGGGGGERGGEVVTLRDDYGRTRTLSTAEAMGESMRQLALSIQQQAQSGGCHLGAAGRHDIPGVTVISGEVVAKAFDVGMQAGIAGADRSSNPFPGGSDAHTVWLRGYYEGTRVQQSMPSDAEKARAFSDGQRTAQAFGPEDEVSCPYRGHLKTEWERGFKEAGGKII